MRNGTSMGRPIGSPRRATRASSGGTSRSRSEHSRRMLATLMHDYPDTLVRAAGDGEIELTDTRLDENTPYESQIIADYSPFTILEFRDWVRHTGLYGPGAQYDGQGRAASGTRYQDDVTGLANFNADFGTSFATWDLCYFNWSLADPIDSDPNAIPASQYTQTTWSPLPTDGPAYIANGFDAPRAWNQPTSQFWQLWLQFREQMISNYVKDFTTWMMTTTTTDGLTVSPSRWYTYQIPADYIYGTYPGCASPDRRLLTGASTMQSANVGSAAGVGVTVFDQYFWNGSTNYYERTSQYLFDAMAAAGFPNWGMIEFNLASPINAVETDPTVIADQIYKGYAAGSHVYRLLPKSARTPMTSTGQRTSRGCRCSSAGSPSSRATRSRTRTSLRRSPASTGM